MLCRILSVQFCSSSVDVHVLWQETEIEKKREREENIILDLQCWFSIQMCNVFIVLCKGKREHTHTDDTLSEISTEFYQTGMLTEVVW